MVLFLSMSALLITAIDSTPVKVEESFDLVDNIVDDERCHWISNQTCPDPEIRFYLYTRSNIDERQPIHIDDTSYASNLSSSFFDPQRPTKIIIHGFRSDMYLTPLFHMKTGEFHILRVRLKLK